MEPKRAEEKPFRPETSLSAMPISVPVTPISGLVSPFLGTGLEPGRKP